MKLSNETLAIEVAEHGAELVSLRKGGHEYLWTGDAVYWNRHAPILFPAVGKPYNNELHADGAVVAMKQHGFARDSEFADLGGGRLRMLANPLAEGYPYRLGLEVCYRLQDSTVEVAWTVENQDGRDAYFQIGAHPGFMLPAYNADDTCHGSILYLDREGKPVSPAITSALDDGNRVPLPEPRRVPNPMPIEADTFAHDALMFEGGQVAVAVLCDKEGNRVIGVGCRQAEAYGVWAPCKPGCPFVCLEPWCGICDAKGFTGDIAARQYIHRLSPGSTYTFAYSIEVYR